MKKGLPAVVHQSPKYAAREVRGKPGIMRRQKRTHARQGLKRPVSKTLRGWEGRRKVLSSRNAKHY
jgi:hypothetical protein